ncbi:MAG: aminomethyl-transferring glycine dehydrogenase subunit GcvPB [Bdellovibrionota bacterium]
MSGGRRQIGGPPKERRLRIPGTAGLALEESLVFERGSPGRVGYSLPETGTVPVADPKAAGLESHLVRGELSGLPELTEFDVVRHFTRLSTWNYSIDAGFFPLGSCTMKYNPKVHERIAQMEGFANGHPYLPEEFCQGALEAMYELCRMLAKISDLAAATVLPAAGAHGELTGLLLIRAYHEKKGRKKKKVLVPDSAHGTNPASAALVGFEVVSIPTASKGVLDVKDVEKALSDDVACIMLTNPNTLGLFERDIGKIAKVLDQVDARLYCDGANFNALMGQASMGKMGVDVSQINLHKTFSTPHGGGGPGSGALVVSDKLAPFLPTPIVKKDGGKFRLDYSPPDSIGRVKGFWGNYGIALRAYAYILTLGAEGIKKASETAIVNANYLRAKLKKTYHLPFDQPCMHEAVFSDKNQKDATGVTTLDIAKRLIDKGFHPPTIYFPLVVPGALMIEPTESETKNAIDQFVQALEEIDQEARENPQLVKDAPHLPFRRRLDETKAARSPKLRWEPNGS